MRVCACRMEWRSKHRRHIPPMPPPRRLRAAPLQIANRPGAHPPPYTTTTHEPTQALRLVKADLEATKAAKAALQAEGETKDATIAALQSKARRVGRPWLRPG